MILNAVPRSALPVPGSPVSDLEAAVEGSLFTKKNGYNVVDLAVSMDAMASGVYSVHRYWQEDQSWKLEGPRGTSPTTFESTGETSIPIRISTPMLNAFLCVVREDDEAPSGEVVMLQEQLR
jgi:hypothetical protein